MLSIKKFLNMRFIRIEGCDFFRAFWTLSTDWNAASVFPLYWTQQYSNDKFLWFG
jgi:hypothetical protein